MESEKKIYGYRKHVTVCCNLVGRVSVSVFPLYIAEGHHPWPLVSSEYSALLPAVSCATLTWYRSKKK